MKTKNDGGGLKIAEDGTGGESRLLKVGDGREVPGFRFQVGK